MRERKPPPILGVCFILVLLVVIGTAWLGGSLSIPEESVAAQDRPAQKAAGAGKARGRSDSGSPAIPLVSPTPSSSSLAVSRTFLLQQLRQSLNNGRRQMGEAEYQQLDSKLQTFSERLKSASKVDDDSLMSEYILLASDIQRAVDKLPTAKRAFFGIDESVLLLLAPIMLIVVLAGIAVVLFKLRSLGKLLASVSAAQQGFPDGGTTGTRLGRRKSDAVLVKTASGEVAVKTVQDTVMEVTETRARAESPVVRLKPPQEDAQDLPQAEPSDSSGHAEALIAPVVPQDEAKADRLQFPLSVAECLKSTVPSQQQRLNFVGLHQRFEPSDAGAFTMISVDDDPQEAFMIPTLTRFETKESYYIPYQNHYECDQPSAGEIIVSKPARIAKMARGWELRDKGRLEVQEYS